MSYNGRNFLTDEELCYRKFVKSKKEFEKCKLPSDAIVLKELSENAERIYCIDGSLDMRYKENRLLFQNEFDFRQTSNKLKYYLKY